MHYLQRHHRILELLKDHPFLSVEEAGSTLDVSPATVRRDFAELARQGLVIRGHGGIQLAESKDYMGVVPFARRRVENPQQKQKIARKAAELLQSGDVVIIDGGTTTNCLGDFITTDIRVITNSLPLAISLNTPSDGRSDVPEVNVTGGYLYPKSAVLLGSQTITSLKSYSAQWTFLGASGMTEDGVLNSNDIVVSTQQEMINRSEKVAILVDESKIGKRAAVKVCSLEDVDVVITGGEISEKLKEALNEADVKLIIAE